MGIVEAVLDMIVSFLKSIPYFNRWFTKTEAEKEQDSKQSTDDQESEEQKTGRPKW